MCQRIHIWCESKKSELITALFSRPFMVLLLEPLCPDQLWQLNTPSLLWNGYWGPGGKARQRRDADHSPPSSAEVKSEELHILPLGACMA
jgi:hypothetical protein